MANVMGNIFDKLKTKFSNTSPQNIDQQAKIDEALNAGKKITIKAPKSERYTYLPKTKTFDDKSDFTLNASVRLLSYGVAAEYALANGMFEEAAVWDKKYKDAIKAAYCSKPPRRIRSRRWA